MERNRNIAEQYREFLSPVGHLVGVKLLKNLEGYENMKQPDKSLTLCQLISQARYLGRTRLVTADYAFSCYLAPQIVGLGEAPKEAWKRYVGWQMSTEEAAKKAYEAVPKLKPGEYSGVFNFALGAVSRRTRCRNIFWKCLADVGHSGSLYL